VLEIQYRSPSADHEHGQTNQIEDDREGGGRPIQEGCNDPPHGQTDQAGETESDPRKNMNDFAHRAQRGLMKVVRVIMAGFVSESDNFAEVP
jgi:hypothetical protein